MSLLDSCYASFVNLDRRTDRLERMKGVLSQAGIQAVRTRGRLPTEYPVEASRVKVMLNRTPGAIGCYFSQMQVMEDAAKQRRHAFVMEDDLIFCDDFHERMAIMETFLRFHQWDIVWLGGTFHINPPYWHKSGLKRDAELTDNPRMMRTYGAFSTHAYIVRYDSIFKVLAMLDDWLDQSIGIDWSMIQMQPRLYTYSFVPGCVIQYDNQSDIGHGMTVYSNFKKLGPYWFQKRMADFDPLKFNWQEARV